MNDRVKAEVQAADQKGSQMFFGALRQYMDDWADIDALDMFSGDGELTVRHYESIVRNLDIWEMNPKYRPHLLGYQPRDLLTNCSLQSLENCKRMYDLVVCDSPQGRYLDGDGIPRYEHFDLLPKIADILKPKAVVALYVNKKPYDRKALGYHNAGDGYDFSVWMAERERFYGIRDGRNLSETLAVQAYASLFARCGFTCKNIIITPCIATGLPNLPPAFRLALELETH